jgi:hypothetical protein
MDKVWKYCFTKVHNQPGIVPHSRETRSYLYMQPFHLIHESAIYNETKCRLLYGQEFYIGEFKKQSCQRTFLGLKEVKVSDLCISILF